MAKRKPYLFFVVALLLTVSVGVILFRPTTSSNQRGGWNSEVNWAGQTVATFVSTSPIQLSVHRGSSTSGSLTLTAEQNGLIRFYIDNGVGDFNSSTPTLPAGIAMTISLNGNLFAVTPYSEVGDLTTSDNPLIPVSQGVLMVQYTLTVSSDTPQGQYRFNIVCASFVNQGSTVNDIQSIEVILSVS